MNRNMIYIFTRLFSPEDRRFSAEIEQRIKLRLTSMRVPVVKTFVPYRDTDQASVIVTNKAKYIYEADLQRLHRSLALVGFLNGMAKDEGICFEIGYAFAIGVPVLVGLTDFFSIQLPYGKRLTFPLDPVLMNMVSKLTRVVEYSDGGKRTYSQQQSLHIAAALDQLTEQLAEYVLKQKVQPRPSSGFRLSNTKTVHIELAGNQFEWCRMLSAEIERALKAKGYATTTSNRLNPTALKRVKDEKSIVRLGDIDIKNVLKSDIVIIGADSTEMDPGAAALQGLARGMNKKLIIYDTKSTLYSASGGHVMSRNLMLDQSADVRANSLAEVYRAVDKLLL
ncbi:nucleoside 2-deoxyribosyltransferase [candidate division WWE3 bacterium]|nr:nucleoside 2-deoxyribosyltransferase [candidate division WWE3 bacterium]